MKLPSRYKNLAVKREGMMPDRSYQLDGGRITFRCSIHFGK